MKPFILILTVAIISLAQLSAEENTDSEKLAMSGRRCWSAFQCAYLAIITEKENSNELFEYAYSEGSTFLEALREEKIKNEDVNKLVPVAVVWNLQGPSNDFILGVLWAKAQEDIERRIKEEMGETSTTKLRELIADQMFLDRNCEILKK